MKTPNLTVTNIYPIDKEQRKTLTFNEIININPEGVSRNFEQTRKIKTNENM